jgi:hypothetical protein
LRAHQLGARFDQRRLQCVSVVGKVIGSPSHAYDCWTITQSRALSQRVAVLSSAQA